ncbi:MAG: hypothetical protein HY939_00170 [Gammaproteobacteria bacterium]|nr:hypothetical protein [Gammaproteobacteria bacterium]
MDVIALRGYWYRNWWIFVFILFASILLSRAVPVGHSHIIFFILFIALFSYKFQHHENRVRERYRIYTQAVYCAEKINMDLLSFLDNLMTVGLVMAAKNTFLEKMKKSLNFHLDPEQLNVVNKLNEMNLSQRIEKIKDILEEALHLSRPYIEASAWQDLIASMEWLYELATQGYFNTREDLFVNPIIITERLILDNQKLSLPDFSEASHYVQATINFLLLKPQREIKEIGGVLENLKLRLGALIDGEVLDAKLKVEPYLSEGGIGRFIRTRIKRN